MERKRSGSLTDPLTKWIDAGLINSVGMMLLLTFLVGLSIFQQRAPAAVDSGAPANQFSSGRAMKHLQSISRNLIRWVQMNMQR